MPWASKGEEQISFPWAASAGLQAAGGNHRAFLLPCTGLQSAPKGAIGGLGAGSHMDALSCLNVPE